MKQALKEFEEVNYFIRNAQSIHLEYICSAVVRTGSSGEEAFANSIIPWFQKQGRREKMNSYFLEMYNGSTFRKFFGDLPKFLVAYLRAKPQRVIFKDGSLIPGPVVDEINTVMDRLTETILWQSGDMMMIDNLRFLHGRRALEDARQRIFSHLSYLKT